MSMISKLIDELQQMADGQATYRDARAVMLQAADTITELRGALQVASVDYRHLQAARDKLLELCEDMFKTIQVMDEEWHSLADFTTMAEAAETYDFDAENAPEYEEKLRELGIEVDG